MTKQADENKIYKPSIFEYIKSISEKTGNVFEKYEGLGYSKFMVNRGVSQHIDGVLLANEMNKSPHISDEMHYDYLYHVISKKKRYGKWVKGEIDDSDCIEYLKQKFKINNDVAVDYLKLLDKKQLKHTISRLKGGIKK